MIALALVAFALFGVVLVAPGVVQAPVARDLGLDLTRSSLVASALAAGLGVGVVVSGPLLDRLPRRPVFVLSAIGGGAALLLAAGPLGFAAVIAAFIGAGLGTGAFETTLNTAIPERDPARATSHLALVHAAATFGAAAGAPLLGAAVAAFGWQQALVALGVSVAGVGALALPVRFPPPAHHGRGTGPRPDVPWRTVSPYLIASFAYVGLETALTVLFVAFALEGGASEARGLRAISFFWGGLLAARLVLAASGRNPGALALAAAGVAGAGLTVLAPFAAGLLELWAGALGLVLGIVFPLVVVLAGARVPERRGLVTGVVVGGGAVGGMLVPAVTGALGDAFGAVSAVTSLAAWSALLGAAGWVGRGSR